MQMLGGNQMCGFDVLRPTLWNNYADTVTLAGNTGAPCGRVPGCHGGVWPYRLPSGNTLLIEQDECFRGNRLTCQKTFAKNPEGYRDSA